MGIKDIDISNVTYYDLNNQINIPVNNKIPLEKDKEALQAFLKENVEPNTKRFSSLEERFKFLIENDYIEKEFVEKYDFEFIKKLYAYLEDQHFEFQSFMAAYKFFNQYALKTNDGNYYLETYEDKIAMNALYMANGDEDLAMQLADELIHQRYQPATPTFLNVGRKRRGEFVSCFLLQPTDDMNSIGRCINSALQLSKIGGGVGITLNNLRGAGAPIEPHSSSLWG